MRDCNRLNAEERGADPLAGHESRCCGAPASSARSSAGMKEGSFWPSPSSVTTTGARAAATPVRTAADCPHEAACLTCRSHGRSAIRRVERRFGAVGRAVVRHRPARTPSGRSARPRSRPTSGAMLSASLRTGTTTETAGFSVAPVSAASPRSSPRSYWPTRRRATFLMRCSEGPGMARIEPSAPDREGRAAAPRTSGAPAARRMPPTTAPAMTSLG